MASLFNLLNEILWESILIYFLLGYSIYLTLRTRFIQFRRWREMFASLKPQADSDPRGLSAWQTLSVTLSGKIGVGNLFGVAMALTAGGPGAIFWMWVIALLGMPIALIETTLAQVFKTRDQQGRFRGGPAEYMSRGLGMRWMGVLFALLMIFSVGLIFNTLQAHAITATLNAAFQIPPLYSSLGLVIIFGVVIFGGLRAIVNMSVWLVPIMSLAYLALGSWVMIANLQQLPAVFLLIVKSAFGLQEFVAGAFGYGVTLAMTQGIQQGLFANEAGVGSAPNVAALATVRHPARIGFSQMLGVFVDTFVLCSATAMIILSSGLLNAPTDHNSADLLQRAITLSIGSGGPQWVALFVLAFAFTTLIAGYLYAENNLLFLQHGRTGSVYLLRLAMMLMLLVGCLTQMTWLWQTASIFLAVMTIINLTALLLLSGLALKVVKDYERQLLIGKEPVFNPQSFPELQDHCQPGIWQPEKPASGADSSVQ